MTNIEWQIDQGIQNDNSSPSLNGTEAFLNHIKKIKQHWVKNATNIITGSLNPTTVGLFWACVGWGGGGGRFDPPPL